jgi:hypothetical protein
MRTLIKLMTYAIILAMAVAVISLALLVFGDDSCPSGTEESEDCILPAN